LYRVGEPSEAYDAGPGEHVVLWKTRVQFMDKDEMEGTSVCERNKSAA
jgi:hypothetical protein